MTARWTPLTDGMVTIRPTARADVDVLVAGRDDESRRWLGEGSPDPRPTACIVVADEVVGWVDVDHHRTWLLPGEGNLGYQLFPEHRGRGYATRALELFLRHLAAGGEYTTATLLVDVANARSLALADRAGFTRQPDLDGHPYFKRALGETTS